MHREFKSKHRSINTSFLKQVEHITLHQNSLFYHFKDEHSAHQVQNIIHRQLKTAFKPGVDRHRCLHAANHARCFTIQLKPMAFDKIFGKNMFNAMQQLLTHPMHYSLKSLSLVMIQQMALIVDSQSQTYFLNQRKVFNPPVSDKTDALICKTITTMVNQPRHPGLVSTEIFDKENRLKDNDALLRRLLLIAPPILRQKSHIDLLTKFSEIPVNFQPCATLATSILKDAKITNVKDKHVIFAQPDSRVLLLKIQTKNESMEEMTRDYQAMLYLKRHANALHLQSHFPQPVAVLQIKELLKDLKLFLSQDQYHHLLKQVETRANYGACLYEYDGRNCQFLDQIYQVNVTDGVYQAANARIVNDLCVLLKQGLIYPQLLGPASHTKSSTLKVSVLDNIFNIKNSPRFNQLLKNKTNLPWKKWVETSPLKISGLTSFVDLVSMTELMSNSAKIKMLYRHLIDIPKDRVINYIFAETIAAYQYALFLLAGKRGVELTKLAKKRHASQMDIAAIWENLANQLIRNAAQIVSHLTHFNDSQVYDFLITPIDVSRLARQMQYWMTDEYVSDVKQNKIKSYLYATQADFKINFTRFNQRIQQSQNADVLRFMGHDPVVEAHKLWQWTENLIWVSYNSMRLTFENLHQVTHETDLQKSEDLRKNSFTHLSGKFFHKMQKNLCETRLATPGLLSLRERQALKAEMNYHTNQHAAFVMTNFLKKTTYSKSESLQMEEKKINRKF